MSLDLIYTTFLLSAFRHKNIKTTLWTHYTNTLNLIYKKKEHALFENYKINANDKACCFINQNVKKK